MRTIPFLDVGKIAVRVRDQVLGVGLHRREPARLMCDRLVGDLQRHDRLGFFEGSLRPPQKSVKLDQLDVENRDLGIDGDTDAGARNRQREIPGGFGRRVTPQTVGIAFLPLRLCDAHVTSCGRIGFGMPPLRRKIVHDIDGIEDRKNPFRRFILERIQIFAANGYRIAAVDDDRQHHFAATERAQAPAHMALVPEPVAQQAPGFRNRNSGFGNLDANFVAPVLNDVLGIAEGMFRRKKANGRKLCSHVVGDRFAADAGLRERRRHQKGSTTSPSARLAFHTVPPTAATTAAPASTRMIRSAPDI